MAGLKVTGSSSDFSERLFACVMSVIVSFYFGVELVVPNKVVWHS